MTGSGHIVCEGITVPVARVELYGGEIVITATRPGPVPAVEGGPVAIFGSDGRGICQGGSLSWQAARDGDLLEAKVWLRMDKVYGPAEE